MTDPGSTRGQAALDEAEGLAVEPITQWTLFKSRFLRHRLAMGAAVVLGVIVLLALFADFLPLQNPTEQLEDANGRIVNLLSPRGEYWFGTDELGQDVLSRVVYGGRTSLTVAILTGAMVATFGTLVGCAALGVSPTALSQVDWSLTGRAFYGSLVSGFRPLLWPFILGNLALGVVSGGIGFLALRAILVSRRARAADEPPRQS